MKNLKTESLEKIIMINDDEILEIKLLVNRKIYQKNVTNDILLLKKINYLKYL